MAKVGKIIIIVAIFPRVGRWGKKRNDNRDAKARGGFAFWEGGGIQL